MTRWHDDALIKLERISWILTPSSGPDGDKIVHVTDEGDPENWHVQVCISCFFTKDNLHVLTRLLEPTKTIIIALFYRYSDL